MTIASDKKFEDWESSDYEALLTSVLAYAIIAVAIFAITFLVMLCLVPKVFCCTKWKQAGMMNGEKAQRGFLACYAFSLVVLMVMVVPAGLGSQMVGEGFLDVTKASATLMHDVNHDLLCGNEDAELTSEYRSCSENTMGAYLQYLYGEVIDVLDDVIADVDYVEDQLETSIDSIKSALGDTNATIANMTIIVGDMAAANTAFVAEMAYLGDPAHTEGAVFSSQLPDAGNLPDSDSLTADVTEARDAAEGALEDVDATVDTLDEVTEEMFDAVREDFGDGGEARGDLVELLEDLFDSVKDASDTSGDAAESLDDAADVQDEQSANEAAFAAVYAGLPFLVGLICLTCATFSCKRSKHLAFAPFQCFTFFCGFSLTWIAFVAGLVTLLLRDLCAEDITLIKTNLNRTFEIGNSTEVVGSDVVIDIINCPTIPDDPAEREPTPENNFVDILGLIDEFNFTSVVEDVEEELEKAKVEIVNMVSDVDEARAQLLSMDDAISMDISGNFSASSMKSTLQDLESSLPAATLDRDDFTAQAAFIGTYADSPTLIAVDGGADATSFFTSYDSSLSNFKQYLQSMDAANPGSVPTDYANFAAWTLADVADIDPSADPAFQTASYPPGETYANDFLPLAEDLQEYTDALNAVEEVNAEAHQNITDAIALLDDIDLSVTKLEAEQEQLGDQRDQVSDALDGLDDGSENGAIYDGVGIIDTAVDGIERIVNAALEINDYSYCGMFGDWWRSAWEVSICEDVVAGVEIVYAAHVLIILFMYALLILTCCFIPEHYLQSTGGVPGLNPMYGDETLYGVQSVNQMEMREITDVKGGRRY